jgi:hypothetical protein
MAVRLWALRGGRPLPPPPPARLLQLISGRGWVDPRAIVPLEGLGQLKKCTSSEPEPAIFPIVQLPYRGPHYLILGPPKIRVPLCILRTLTVHFYLRLSISSAVLALLSCFPIVSLRSLSLGACQVIASRNLMCRASSLFLVLAFGIHLSGRNSRPGLFVALWSLSWSALTHSYRNVF